jgi:hypothetical protein
LRAGSLTRRDENRARVCTTNANTYGWVGAKAKIIKEECADKTDIEVVHDRLKGFILRFD